jgi:hypothetical protein
MFEQRADAAEVANAKAIHLGSTAAARALRARGDGHHSGASVPANLSIRNFDRLFVHDKASASA